MFAVPGWNISANSLAQETPPTAKSASNALHSSSEKKRKRSGGDRDAARKIEGAELERRWNESFGGQKTKQGKLKKQSKQSRNAINSRDSQTQANARPSGSSTSSITNDTLSSRRAISKKQRQDHQSKGDSQSQVRQENLKDRPTLKSNQPRQRSKGPDGLPASVPPSAPAPATSTLTALQQKMHSKLTSARFRHLNQTLYTTPSSSALTLFKTTPSLFTEYHQGFTQQVQSSWPVNPVEVFIQQLLARGALDLHPSQKTPSNNATASLPRRKTGSCTVADLGCGDAPLARALHAHSFNKLNLRIHSFDLHSPNKFVTAADIANLPLRDGEADVTIFCLSLMGTNWIDFVEEAWRVLRGDGKGEAWVAEVKSRFGRKDNANKNRDGEAVEHSVGKRRKVKKPKSQDADGDDDTGIGQEVFATTQDDNPEAVDTTDLAPFIAIFQRRGLTLQPTSVDKSNKMFVRMEFVKAGVPTAGKYKGWKWNGKEYAAQHDGKMRFVSDEREITREEEDKVLKPCVYKLR